MKNSKPNCPLYIEKEKVTVETTNQNKLPSVQWRNKQNNSPVGYTGKWSRQTCLQEFNDTATRWVHGWSRLVIGHKEAEVTEVKPSQNLTLLFVIEILDVYVYLIEILNHDIC